MDAFVISSLPRLRRKELPSAGPLCSNGVTRLHRYYGPIRHPLSTSPLPGVAGYRLRLLRAFLLGPRRASPVALHVLATVPPLPPRRSEFSYQPEFDYSCCLRLDIEGSASGDTTFRGHLAFTCVAARQLAHRSMNSFVDGLQPFRFPSRLPSKLRESGSFPGRTGSCRTCLPYLDAQCRDG